MPSPPVTVAVCVAALVLLAALVLAVATGRIAARVEREFPPSGAFVELDGARLHYRASGPEDAPAVLLLHGASANLRDFDSNLRPALEGELRVVAVDRPGSGWSEPLPGTAGDPAAQARAVDRLLAALGIERALWVGHSWGGAVALAAAVERPARVAGAVLLAAPTAPWEEPAPWPLRLGALPLVGAAFAHTLVTPLGLRSLDDLLEGSFAPERAPEPIEIYARGNAAALGLVPERFRATARDLVGLPGALARLAPRLGGIERPLLLVYGERDPLMAPARHAAPLAAALAEAELVTLPGAGHLVHHTRTDVVAAHIARLARIAFERRSR